MISPPKSFSLPRVEVDATLQRDGSLAVVEHITYDFTGRFSYGTRPIPGGPYLVTDMHVSEHGRELTSVGAPYNVQWFFTAEDERRTFDIAYRVQHVVQVGPDVGELYWKWVGEDHPVIESVVARLTLPAGGAGSRAWGHGPLSGRVDVHDDRVVWRAHDVARGSFVEGRVAVPSTAFAVAATTEPRLTRILAEERSSARAANDARRAARRDAEHEEQLRDVADVVAPTATGLALLVFAFLFVRFGREPSVPDIGPYLRDLPDDPPGIVDLLLHWGRVRPAAFSATILDLAQRGHLAIEEQREPRWLLPDVVEYHFARATDHQTRRHLADFEQNALQLLFAKGSPTTRSDLVRWAREDPTRAHKSWKRFEAKIARAYDEREYQHGHRGLVALVHFGVVALTAAAGFFALSTRAWAAGALAIAWAVVQLCLTPLLRQRTRTGAQRASEWHAVARFLRDFSQLESAPVGHLVLWERYLVAAVALGVSDELLQGLRTSFPEAADQVTVGWYSSNMGPDGDWGRLAGIGGFAHDFGSDLASASTPPSSGGGGGGGFSGGGGGGGGGGGIGAG